MVKASNQGLDDRYIRLRSHRISHPVVSGLRQSHSITFSRPGFRPGFHVWFRSTKKLMAKNKDTNHTNATNPKGAAKVRAAAISIPGFADQEQENKTRGLQEPQLLF
ncbi:unnamed protein product [Porites evermanni]|uniref:Uncharacterized protein n=1 Tax=Porites evermanni TaxID=104178 RepID=A0ABN8M7J9_9CNID|nr:unnamed protein product [Porites evermanni]